MCPKCGAKKACGLHHVYVIELDRNVLKEPRFVEDSKSLSPGARCFYVGQTSHRVECRYKQHVARRRGRPGTGFLCACEEGIETKVLFDAYNRGNRYVRIYHQPSGLRPELFAELNPIRGGQEHAIVAEKALAETLRSQSHLVYFN